MSFSNEAKWMAANREFRYRQRVYPHLIKKKIYSEREAEHQIALMQEIMDDYRRLADEEETARGVFPTVSTYDGGTR